MRARTQPGATRWAEMLSEESTVSQQAPVTYTMIPASQGLATKASATRPAATPRVAPTISQSSGNRRRRRGSSAAAVTAPTPTQPISTPKPRDPRSSCCSATTGSSAHSPLAKTLNSAPRASTVRTGREKRTKRTPARIAGASCSRPPAALRRRRSRSTTAITAAMSAASMENRAPALSTAIHRPARAGPTARARLMATPFSATAAGSSVRETTSGVSDW